MEEKEWIMRGSKTRWNENCAVCGDKCRNTGRDYNGSRYCGKCYNEAISVSSNVSRSVQSFISPNDLRTSKDIAVFLQRYLEEAVKLQLEYGYYFFALPAMIRAGLLDQWICEVQK